MVTDGREGFSGSLVILGGEGGANGCSYSCIVEGRGGEDGGE